MATLANLARMTTSTTGTGTITLGTNANACLTFADAGITNGQTVSYGIEDGDNSEVGRGLYTSAGTTLTRTVLKSTNSNNPINLSGTAEVFIIALTEDIRFSGARVKKAADQTAANYTTATAVAFDAEDFDTDGFHDNATNNTRLTIPAGKGIRYVELYGCVEGNLDANDTFRTLLIKQNGTTDVGGTIRDEFGSGFYSIEAHSGPVQVVDGDYFELFFLTESDTSITIVDDLTRFTIRVVG